MNELPERERYVTRAQLAELMGVSLPTIDRMVREGMPSEVWGMRARRFLPSVAIAWARTWGERQASPMTSRERRALLEIAGSALEWANDLGNRDDEHRDGEARAWLLELTGSTLVRVGDEEADELRAWLRREQENGGR